MVAVDGIVCAVAALPVFSIGCSYNITVKGLDKCLRDTVVKIPQRKGTKQRPPMVEPKPISYKMISPKTGMLRITYFSGASGLGFARLLDSAIAALKQRGCDRLIVDLRGNLGGSLGFARLASYLCEGRIPIGHSLTPARMLSGYRSEELARVVMPRSRAELFLTLGKFAFQDKSVMLMTQGLGQQPFHGRIVLLLNEWTNSAAGIVASFAAENRLAQLIGVKTAGNVLGAANFKVGVGYWLLLPIFGWHIAW